jgi:voltage-gated potassium channel
VDSVAAVTESGEASVRPTLRQVVFRALDTATDGSWFSRIVDVVLVALISASVIAVVLESINALEIRYSDYFYWFEVLTVSVFSVEYLLRVWSSVEAGSPADDRRGPLAVRLRFMLSFHALIDLVAILPFYLLTFGIFGSPDMRFLRAIRLLRVLKLTRYSAALNMLITTIVENGRNLLASFFVLLTVMLLAASGIYYFERDAQPVDFGSIPAAMWWAFATLTTVGYGDVTPVTVGGKVFGACITVVGLGMVALPTGILASGFAHQLRMRSDEYQAMAEDAWDDGILSDAEINSLEKLRVDLGLSKHTASQILDAGKVRRALEQERGDRCPHCGGGLPER